MRRIVVGKVAEQIHGGTECVERKDGGAVFLLNEDGKKAPNFPISVVNSDDQAAKPKAEEA